MFLCFVYLCIQSAAGTGFSYLTLLETNPVQFYIPTPDDWLKCPEDWDLVGNECLRLIPAVTSWDSALRQCNGFGGDLLRIEGRNFNNAIGRKILDQLKKWQMGKNDSDIDSFWIGYSCKSSSVCEWSSNVAASFYDGFWAINQPNTSVYDTACAGVSLGAESRWSLGDCSDSKPFVCTAKPCFKDQFRCTDGKKCVPTSAKCDGNFNCDDLSDEQNCPQSKKHLCSNDINGVTGTIASPNHPLNYPARTYCVWKITVPISSRVQIKFTNFHVELDYDSITIYDGHVAIGADLLGSHSGVDLPSALITSTNLAFILFRSDHNTQFPGFALQWNAVGFRPCGGDVVTSNKPQWIVSPMYPARIPGKLLCTWVLRARHDRDTITLQFMDHELAAADWIQIWDGDQPTSLNLKGRFTQSNVPRVVISSSNALTVRFKSLHLTPKRGFNASHWSGCYVYVSDVSATISSPGYGKSNYPNKLNCTWDIRHPQHAPLTMVFNKDFETEEGRDSVIIDLTRNGTTYLNIGTYSGTDVPPPVRSLTGEIRVRFKSDFSINHTGWQASFSFDCVLREPALPLTIKKPYNTHHGSEVTYSCTRGYRLFGERTRRCGQNGAWLTGEPLCLTINCGRPPVVAHASVKSVTTTLYNGVTVYSCHMGYIPLGPWNVTCRENGWTDAYICSEVFCDVPKLRPNTFFRGGMIFPVGSIITYFCRAGFVLKGSAVARCLVSVLWSRTSYCERATCPPVGSLPNCEILTPEPVPTGSRLHLRCHAGYADQNGATSQNLMCNENNASYHGNILACSDIDECIDSTPCFPHICVNSPGAYSCVCLQGYSQISDTQCQDKDECRDGTHKCDETCTNTLGSYTCQCSSGKVLYGGKTQRINGRELISGRTCVAPLCPPLHIINCALTTNTPSLSDGRYLDGSRVTVACKRGYKSTGVEVVVCKHGVWLNAIPQCIQASCGQLSLARGFINYTHSLFYGSIATHSCVRGYTFHGSVYRVCASTVRLRLNPRSVTDTHLYGWSGSPGQCRELRCLKPPVVQNAIVRYKPPTTYMTQAWYTCHKGHMMVGRSNIMCLVTGEWSDPPLCLAQFCEHPGVPRYGQLEGNNGTIFPVGQCVYFRCTRQGYVLSHPSSGWWPTFGDQQKKRSADPYNMCCIEHAEVNYTDHQSESSKSFYTYPALYQFTASMDFTGKNVSTSCVSDLESIFLQVIKALRHQINSFCSSSGTFRFQFELTDESQITGNKIHLMMKMTVSVVIITVDNGWDLCITNLRKSLPAAVKLSPSLLEIKLQPPCGDYVADSSSFQFTSQSYVCHGGHGLLNKTCIKRRRLLCMTCRDEISNERCNSFGSVIECPDSQDSCETTVRSVRGGVSVTKSCRPTLACGDVQSNSSVCSGDVSDPVCSACCNDTDTVCNLPLAPEIVDFYNMHIPKKPVWSRPLPQCKDVTPPVYTHCPRGYKIDAPMSNTVQLPAAYFRTHDNSGEPVQLITDPEGIQYPYPFTGRTTVRMTAVDSSHNIAHCVFIVEIIDFTAPVINCPDAIIPVYYHQTNATVRLIIPNITVFDAGGLSSVIYQPTNGTSVALSVAVKVKVTAIDTSGNVALCDFYVYPQPIDCPKRSLNYPPSVSATCSESVQGLRDKGYMCALTCPRYFDFATVNSSYEYTCTSKGIWYPFTYIPDCTDQLFPNYTVTAELKVVSSPNCTQEVLQLLTAMYNKILNNPCPLLSSYYAVSPAGLKVKSQESKSVTIKVTVVISVIKPSLRPNTITSCGQLVKTYITDSNNQHELTTSCGKVIVSGVESNTVESKYSCDDGYTFKKGFCLPCTAGMKYNKQTSRCDNCPVAYYQEMKAQLSCLSCPVEHSTIHPHTKKRSQCLAQCPPGKMSRTGLEPCVPCSVGWYQVFTGQTTCTQCPVNQSTPARGDTSKSGCRQVCVAGEYSRIGLAPCVACPRHTYQDRPQQTLCIQCSDVLATRHSGSTDISDCIDINQCENHTCQHGASCINRHRHYECNCTAGYEGMMCETRIDLCRSAPCLNNGSCDNYPHSYYCRCKLGFSGKDCEVRVKMCDDAPCDHGTCVDLTYPNFKCICHEGYTDDRCETMIDYCVNSPCKNGGICSYESSGYTCDCQDTGYEGPDCTRGVNDCATAPCVYGKCIDKHKEYWCKCFAGYTGNDCEVEVNECENETCSGHGECDDRINSYKCHCHIGWMGKQCSVNIDDCKSRTCQNGGTCHDLVNDFKCICPGRVYEGKQCDQMIDYCERNHCSLNHTLRCETRPGNYVCVCDVGYTGKNCDMRINWCDPFPCLNQAACNNHLDSYSCNCTLGYTGRNCSVNKDDCYSSPCLNNATCEDGVNSFTCSCPAGWTGHQCGSDIVDCTPSICDNGATCEDITNGYICHCAKGYTGSECEIMVDHCLSLPCVNGVSCLPVLNDYTCMCQPGYTGKSCEVNIDDCDPNPCENKGTCVDKVNEYKCKCPEEFIGRNCSEHYDDCAERKVPCANGGVCVDGWRTSTCDCPARYALPNCVKEKSPDYDLFFLGVNGSSSKSPQFFLTSIKGLTVCLWVRFAGRDIPGTFFVLYQTINGSDRPRVQLSESKAEITHDFKESYDWSLADGKWHHVCVSMNPLNKLRIFLDTKVIADKEIPSFDTSSSYKVILGQGSSASGNQFYGDLSQVNLYSHRISPPTHATNCTPTTLPLGDVSHWLEYDMVLSANVRKVEPAMCGLTNCTPGYRGTFCDIKIDLIAPTVDYCLNEVKVINDKNRLNVVNYKEPKFSDNIGVTNIIQTHRPGQVLSYGEYMVTYIASDEEGNFVMCNFNIYVIPYDCISPPPPKSGASACKAWTHGIYCHLDCFDYHSFIRPIPPFYKCGADGVWDSRSLVTPFRFPNCLALYPPLLNIVGILGVKTQPSTACSPQFRASLRDNFIRIMSTLDQRLGLCGGVCTYENVVVNCDNTVHSRKRATDPLNVTISFSLPAKNDTGPDYAITEAMKSGTFNDLGMGTTLKQESVEVTMEKNCPRGQILVNSQSCVSCEEGSYETGGECRLCPVGEYTDLMNRTSCDQCPVKHVTRSPGATSLTDCYVGKLDESQYAAEDCMAGWYYNNETQQCEACDTGYYQNLTGQASCTSCPNGQSTLQPASTSRTQCVDTCAAGSELTPDNTCRECSRGTYRNSSMTACSVCPYGFVTMGDGATSISQCDLYKCERGHTREARNRVCVPCVKGTYEFNQACIRCGDYLTTNSEASVSKKQCVPVEKCAEMIKFCSTHAVCTDTVGGMKCHCTGRYAGNGTSCTDMCVGHCMHGGTCSLERGRLVCECVREWSGERCHMERTTSLLNLAGIIGGSAGAALFISLSVLACCCLRKKNRGKKDQQTKFGHSNKTYESPDQIIYSNPEFRSISLSQRPPAEPTADYDVPMQPWKEHVYDNTQQDNVYNEIEFGHEVQNNH